MFRSKDALNKPKYIGTSRAVVTDNRDPGQRGRIQIDHAILGQTSWIPYLNVPGMFSAPSIGDIVFVTCESGEPEHSYAWGNITKGNKAKPELPDRFKRDIPTNRGIYSPGGNYIELDDGEAASYTQKTTKKRGIHITSTSGHTISIKDDPENGVEVIEIRDKSGDGISFDSKNKIVELLSKGTLSLASTDATTIESLKNIQLHAPNDVLGMDAKSIVMGSTDTTEITADTRILVAGKVESEFGSSGGLTQVKGSSVLLAGGSVGVARLGDRAFGIGNLGGPVSSTIIQGSSKVFSG